MEKITLFSPSLFSPTHTHQHVLSHFLFFSSLLSILHAHSLPLPFFSFLHLSSVLHTPLGRISPLPIVRNYNRKQKNEMLLRRVTTSLSLRNYLPPPERYAKRLQQIFLQDTMEPRNLCLF